MGTILLLSSFHLLYSVCQILHAGPIVDPVQHDIGSPNFGWRVARSQSPPESLDGVDHQPLEPAQGELDQLAPGQPVGKPEIISPQPPL
jgi:hypothetical protein